MVEGKKVKIFVCVLMCFITFTGCAVVDLYTKTIQAHDCVVEHFEKKCSGLETDEKTYICLEELQSWCVHEAVAGNLGKNDKKLD